MRKAPKGARPHDVDSGYLQPLLMNPFKKGSKNEMSEKYAEYHRIKSEYDLTHPGIHYYTREAYLKQVFIDIFL